MSLNFALVGNPNCGKTTLFNAVTGAAQYVGNWAGVTVEKKEGHFSLNGIDGNLIDLPGIYSLSPYTPEEIVSRRYILESQPDLIINIVDATNLERNLYLTTQLAELGKPMIIALNMIDMLEKSGLKIDASALEDALGIPVCAVSAAKGTGVDELLHRAIHILHDTAHNQREHERGAVLNRATVLHSRLHSVHSFADTEPNYRVVKSFYEWEVASAVEAIEDVIRDIEPVGSSARFMAVKLFEGDPLTPAYLQLDSEHIRQIEDILNSVKETEFVDRQMMVADQRYKFIGKVCKHAVKHVGEEKISISEKIDKVITNRYLAIPIFFAIMFLVFYITFGPFGSMLTDFVDGLLNGTLSDILRSALTAAHTADWATSLLCDGMLAGVGAVLSFLPQIALLFFFLSLLEDSGYMARAAFIMDKPLRGIGLTGKSFVSLLMGFGCTVPAVLSTRTLESTRDKRLTVLLVPFMSCSAKMPVYALFIAAFFKESSALVILALYGLGILLAVLSGVILKSTILKAKEANFLMEMPPYRVPTLKGLCIHIWERLKDFLLKAGTVLLGASVIVWFLQSMDTTLSMTDNSAESLLAKLGTLIAPIFVPLGFGFWQAAVALLSGLVAKETVVSTLGILFLAHSEAAQTAALQTAFTPLSAFSFLVFVLLYTPCFAAISGIAKEMRSAKWTAFSILLQLGTAWLVSFIVYNVGSLMGL